MRNKLVLPALITLASLAFAQSNLFAADSNTHAEQQGGPQPEMSGNHHGTEQSRESAVRKIAQARAVVGQPFPASLKAQDALGKVVMIRDLLHGPTILVQLSIDSKYSDAVLTYLREHGLDYAHKHHSQVMVVIIDYYDDNDYANMLRGLPKDFVTLHVTGSYLMDLYQNPVLGGGILPLIVFLDKDLVVIDRRLGFLENAETTLGHTSGFQ